MTIRINLSNLPTTIVATSLITLSGCNNNEEKVEVPFANVRAELITEVQTLVEQNQLKGLGTAAAKLPKASDPISKLGMQLFFSKSLGGDMDSACASCHHPFLGGGDALPLSIGVGALNPNLLGPGRMHDAAAAHADGGPTVPRNAPSTFNIAFYNEAFFHDGRVETLSSQPTDNGEGTSIRTPDSPFASADPNAGANLTAAQARFPVTSKEEMRGFTYQAAESNQVLRDALAERLQGKTNELSKNNWLDAFAKGFNVPSSQPGLISFDNIAFALGQYQRSQVMINSPWARFVAGDSSALTTQQLHGAKLFYSKRSEGGFECVACHSGDFMTDERFHIVAVPQIGRGKGNGDTGDHDFGRYRETKNEMDKFAFRTPHLLNVEVTAPYGHDGAFLTLEGIVKHHLNPMESVASYDPTNIQPGIQTSHWIDNTEMALSALKDQVDKGSSPLAAVNYSPVQITYIVSFLQALTDPCAKDKTCLNQWIPSADMDMDNTLLLAEFQ